MENMKKTPVIKREWAMPNKNTFSIKPIKDLIQRYLKGKWIDPFANDSTFKDRLITNDINKTFKTDYNLDALEFLKQFNDNSIDGILFDPPYSIHQINEVYDGFGKIKQFSRYAIEIKRIIKPKGYCISFGWNSNGMPYEMKIDGIKYKTGFNKVKKEILIIPHGGCHNDTLVTVDQKIIEEQTLNVFNS